MSRGPAVLSRWHLAQALKLPEEAHAPFHGSSHTHTWTSAKCRSPAIVTRRARSPMQLSKPCTGAPGIHGLGTKSHTSEHTPMTLNFFFPFCPVNCPAPVFPWAHCCPSPRAAHGTPPLTHRELLIYFTLPSYLSFPTRAALHTQPSSCSYEYTTTSSHRDSSLSKF